MSISASTRTTSRCSTTSSATSRSRPRSRLPARCASRGSTGDVRLDAARVEVDRVLQLFYNPYAEEALPEVQSAEREVEGSGSAEEATRTAFSTVQQPAGVAPEPGAAPGAAPAGRLAQDAERGRSTERVRPGRARHPHRRAGQPGPARQGYPARRTDGHRARQPQYHGRRRPAHPEGTGRPGGTVGTVDTVRGTYEFQGRRFDLVRGGTIRFTGTPTINPLLDVSATRTFRTPASRRECTSPAPPRRPA